MTTIHELLEEDVRQARMRSATVREAAFSGGETAANLAMGQLRQALIQAGVGGYGTVKLADEREREEFKQLLKARFEIVVNVALEEL